MDIYYRYSKYLKEKYGVKTYKLPVNIPVSCPNRDGFLSEGGCSFCGEMGAGFENYPASMSVKEQLEKNKTYIGNKYGAEKFIAYFQNFSNTYLPVEKLLKYLEEATEVNDIAAIILSTRPDCINNVYLKKIKEKMEKKVPEINLGLELGLQTVNYHTLTRVNRGHTLGEVIDAILNAQKYNFEIGIHLILNLPGDNMVDVIENAKIISALKVDNVKLHALYIREGTEFAEKYKKGEFDIIPLEEYVERVITFLEYLDPQIAIQRLLGRAPEEKTLFANWDKSWWKIYNIIIEEMKKRKTYQGKKFEYLQGKALKKFIK
ncbi:TIGR01212 family radical SAM protein [Halothermothrix orenii]|uniref:Radical SAM protein, TIGR01212 family n=1 Tax=Halothermothrix orenii (strain H 168 / OCM 544 / DSM 9562) TaxID=373903 RepID=B8CXD0_HALOH|nr:TIGR01212 family radical SAM protein [Halothermothrix orenii]ACL69949.1 radical SAM protein, TIGR01212 family [Halothermothrix orenii H 168]